MAKLKISDFWAVGTGMKRLDEICDSTGLNISLITYMRIGSILTPACQKLTNDPLPISITKLLSGNKKGSKNIRNALENHIVANKKHDLTKLRQVVTFFGLIGIPVPGNDVAKLCHTLWTHHFLPNKIREFSFKLYNNMLGINTRVAHFNQAINPGCAICRWGGGEYPPKPSFIYFSNVLMYLN
jgi:hypothetical protein